MIGGIDMPNIKPISDLRNYTAVINEVAYGNRVYLTRNGHGQCAIIDMKELDELDKQKALYQLMSKLNEAEISIREEGTISADDLEKEYKIVPVTEFRLNSSDCVMVIWFLFSLICVSYVYFIIMYYNIYCNCNDYSY